MAAVADELEAGAGAPATEELWRAGARRRARHRLVAGAGVLVAVLLVGLVLAPWGALTAVPASLADEGVRGYPQRIGHQWWTPGLGEKPGPVAGLLQSVEEVSGHTDWLAVMPGGGLRRLPAEQTGNDSYPSLSDDGRVVGYLAGPDGPYVLHDLVSGREERFGDITDGAFVEGSQPNGRWWTNGQTPSWFSPEGTRLALAAGSGRGGGAVLLGLDGSATPLPGVETARIAGWRDDHTLIGVTVGAPLALWTYDVHTQRLTQGATISRTHIDPDFVSQWTFRWSPTAHSLVYETDESDGTRRLGLVNPDTGEVATTVPLGGDNAVVPCGPVVASGGPAVNAHLGGSAALLVPAVDGGSVLARTDPAIDARCILWAEDALAGDPGWTLWGTTSAWWSWWWREALAGLAVVAGLALVVRVRSRRWATLTG